MPTILLLDDDVAFRQTAGELLRQQAYEVVACGRGDEARRRLSDRCVDLLLLDFLLPDVDGVRFLRQLRITGVTAKAMLVSHFWKQSDAELLREGFEVVLHKPVPPATLVAKVRRLLGDAPVPLDPQGEKALSELRSSYALELPTLVDGLRSAVAQLRVRPAETVLRGVVRRRAHQIAGTAGSFGFGTVGDACAQIESALFTQAGIAWDRIELALGMLGGPSVSAAV